MLQIFVTDCNVDHTDITGFFETALEYILYYFVDQYLKPQIILKGEGNEIMIAN